MAVGDIKPVYATPTSSSGGLTSLASSSTWVAGYEWFLVDVAAMSPIPRDVRHQGKIRVGTTPTVNTEIRIYLVASENGSTWPDVFDGTPSAETVTSAGVRDGFAKLAAVLPVDSTTSDRDYPYSFSAQQVFGGSLPDSYVLFVAHNTGVALNATAAEHTYIYTPQYDNATLS
jgi:hypothetical protein